MLSVRASSTDNKANRRAHTAAAYVGAFALYWHLFLETQIEDDGGVTTNRAIESAGVEGNGAKAEGAVMEADAEGDVAVPDEIPDDAIFIPLGRVRQRPKEYYKGSDQEWQNFVEFAQDKKKNALVRRELSYIWQISCLY